MDKLKPFFLIAEDDPDDQFLMENVINEICPDTIDTHFVKNGVELIDKLLQKDGVFRWPDLVILDLNMPQKDGRQALREIKADPNLAAIPIIIMTTSQVHEDVRYCQDLGVVGYFQKPSSISELRAIIRKLVQEYCA
jgi:CheY-like chemotaxis protein